MRYLDQLKKVFVLAVAAISISILNIGPVGALTNSEYYLAQISDNTYRLLQIVQNPANFAGLAVSWMQQDTGDSSIITTTQQNLAMTGWSFTTSQLIIKMLQKQITLDMLDKPASDFEGKNPPILVDLPDVNAISYSSLIGVPPVADAPVDFYGYIKNAAGFNTVRPVPNSSWDGDEDSKKKYKDYYNTVTAVESFNAYIISQLAVDSILKVNEARDQVVNTASSSSWIANIATEELGRVLRQILLFESQNFVINTEIQKNLRQLVAAQAMTNTLMIKFNVFNEAQLIRSAKGKDETGGY